MASKVLSGVVLVLFYGSIMGCGGGEDGPASESKTAGTITISGAWALYPLVVKWAEEYRLEHPDVTIDVSAGGAGKGMTDCLCGAADLGMVSRDIYPQEEAQGAHACSVAKDAVVGTVNKDNPAWESILAQGVRQEKLAGIWLTGQVTSWSAVAADGPDEPIHVYSRSDACGAAETWARYLGGHQEDLQGVGVYGDPGLAKAIEADVLGIGFNNVNYAYDPASKEPLASLRVLPIDLNGNGQLDEDEDFYQTRDSLAAAIAQGRYPSPPARLLHLVTKGAAEKPVVKAFLIWILTEGQQYVETSGYITIPSDLLAQQLKELQAVGSSEE